MNSAAYGLTSNLAEKISMELHKNGKTDAVVIAHVTQANPKINWDNTKDSEQDHRHGEILFTTTESGHIGKDVIKSYLDKKREAEENGEEYDGSKEVWTKE